MLSALALTSCKENNVLSEQELSEGWQLLFDGKSMEGWRIFNGEASALTTWGVDRGMIISSGTGADSTGCIITEKQYENFIVRFDWKIEEAGSGGFLYHVLERPGYRVPYSTGPEYQLFDEVNFPGRHEEWEKTAGDLWMYAPDSTGRVLTKPRKWNSSEIIFDNGNVEYRLNHEKVLGFEAWSDDWFKRKESGRLKDYPEYGLSRNGHFALHDKGSRIWFRNIKIKELPRKQKQDVLFNGNDLAGWQVFGSELWYVENGEIVCKNGPKKEYGYLGTRKYYDDFDLTLRFRQETTGTGGVFIRSYITTGINIAGWQVQIGPHGNNAGGIYESYGRGWLTELHPEKEDILRREDWNEMRIRVKGDSVITWLNGALMSELLDQQVGKGKGRIMLQIHKGGGNKIRFRDIILQEL